MNLEGSYYTAGSSRSEPRTLYADTQGRFGFPDAVSRTVQQWFYVRNLEVSARIGDTPRQIRFPDGGLFETEQNDIIDQVVSAHGVGRLQSLVHRLESKLRYVVGSAVVILAMIAVLMIYVVPSASKHLAMSLPVSVTESVGSGSLELLDSWVFDTSELTDQRQREIRSGFAGMTGLAASDHSFLLLFRKSPQVGPNAFALPDGTLVITDELVQLAQNDEQIMAVLAHEMGHVIHRHGLRQVLQSTGLSVLLILVTGDIVSATNLAAAIPGFLLESHYSRGMESEADDFALEFMKQNGPEPIRFAEIMQLLEQWQQEHYDSLGGQPAFLSSHPATEERISRFR
ncbi:MAG: M48 family metallopeptidase [Endozoicomonas sp.]